MILVDDINPILTGQKMFGGGRIISPFVMFRQGCCKIIPAWLEILEREPSEDEMIAIALRKDTVIPQKQRLETWHDLPAVHFGHVSSRLAKAYTTHHWLELAPNASPLRPTVGEFRFLKGNNCLGWFFGTVAENKEAARKFIADHESHSA